MWSFTVLVITAFVWLQAYGFVITPRNDGRIVGGEDADIANYPYQLSLQRFGKHLCGASIIAAKVALTAAHCTHRIFNVLKVRSGSNYTASGGVLVQVLLVRQHVRYNPITIDYDVSVLKLVSSLTLTIIPLQPKGEEISVGVLGTVTGWGTTTEDGIASTLLQKVEVAHISDSQCNTDYENGITPRMTCYSSPGKDSCQGDSGGPLVVDHKQVGIVSWGYGCAQPQYPGVYTKISDSNIYSYIMLSMF